MKRLVAFILAILTLGGFAMARDTAYQHETPMHGETEAERLLNSPRGQELRGVVDLLMKGDKEAADRALEEYRKKYNPAPAGSPYPGRQGPARPSQPFSGFSRPMVLPPEAR